MHKTEDEGIKVCFQMLILVRLLKTLYSKLM